MDSNDKNPFERTNQFYIAQVTSMEIKISELKAQLHAKDFEIDYLSGKLSASHRESGKSRDWHEMELKLKIATQENQLLKAKISEFQEVHIIKSQLDQALHMKNVFEGKYRELKSQVMVDEKDPESSYSENERMKSLKNDLENTHKLVEGNKEKLKEAFLEIRELKQELSEKNAELQELRKKGAYASKTGKSNVEKNWYSVSPITNMKPGSASNTRKNSPSVKQAKGSTFRTNFQYLSPKPASDYIIRPKIVSISLESTLNPPPN